MAIEHRASASAAASAASSSTPLVINRPAGTTAGDVLLASIDWTHGGGTTATGICTPPEGWTSIRKTLGGGSIRRVKETFYRVAGSSEPSSYSFPVAGVGAATSVEAAGGISAYSGASTSAPVNAHGGETISGSLTEFTAPSVTTTKANCLVVAFAGTHNTIRSFTPPGSSLEAFDVFASSLIASASAYDKAPVAAGMTGTRVLKANATAAGATHTIALAPAPVKGKAAGSGSGGGSAKGTRGRKGKAAGTGTGSGSAAGTVHERPNRLRVRERIPMRIRILATAPSGKTYPWAENAASVDQVIDGLTDSDKVSGGCDQMQTTLARKPGVDYGDMVRGTRLELFGSGQLKLGEFRLERAPRTSGDKLVMESGAPGYEAHLVDDNSVQEIYIDPDLGSWGETSAKRRAEVPSNKYGNATIQVIPAGTPDPANPSLYSEVPALSHSWASIDNTEGPDVAESWYDAAGAQIGRILVDFLRVKGLAPGDTNWHNQVRTSQNGVTLLEELKDFDATSAHADLTVAAERYFLMLRDYYASPLEKGLPGNWETQWRNVKVLGRHGLPLYGVWPNVGLLASDIVAHALTRWAPKIHFTTGAYGSIKPSSFVIPSLSAKEPTNVADIIQQATRFELQEWGVWPGAKGPTFYMNQRGEREGRKRWRARVKEAKLEDTGQQFDRVFNGVIVQGQGTDGVSRHIGPAGSGLRLTDPRLADSDPLNPATQAGVKRYAKIQMKGVCTVEGMIEAGEVFLEQSRALDASGKATLTGYVEDENGHEWPYYCVHAGDLIDFVDSSVPGYRYIVSASRNRAGRSVEVNIDAPPDGYEAILERLNAEMIGIGLAS